MRMNEQTHRLTDLPGEKHPQKCQLCGESDFLFLIAQTRKSYHLARWQEHDHNDRPEQRLIVLCTKCSKRVIESHPRLYSELQDNQPWPGCMALCIDCKLRDGITCTSPKAKVNGGPGVIITVPKPSSALVDGPKYRGPMLLWSHPPEKCSEKVQAI